MRLDSAESEPLDDILKNMVNATIFSFTNLIYKIYVYGRKGGIINLYFVHNLRIKLYNVVKNCGQDLF